MHTLYMYSSTHFDVSQSRQSYKAGLSKSAGKRYISISIVMFIVKMTVCLYIPAGYLDHRDTAASYL